jgi:RNA 2',3'-cyclic 3'-phosphodiesterase
MRIFVAVNLPEAERLRIHEAMSPLREAGLPVRWTLPESYHLTLKFLGEVRPELVARLPAALDKVAAATIPFHVELSGVGAFPTIRRPQVIWLGVEPTPALRCLKQDLEWALADHGFERETRAFHPHITLGRTQDLDGAGAFRGLDDLAATLDFSGRMDIESVDLMRSQIARQGNRYTRLHASPLRPPGGRK